MIQFYSNSKYVSLEIDYYFSLDWTIYKIPKWFLFDGGSIPPILWSILKHPFYYKYIEYYLRHDALYSDYFNKHHWWVSRKRADKKLRNDIWWIRWWIIYLWVRLFGKKYYWQKLKIDKMKLETLFK